MVFKPVDPFILHRRCRCSSTFTSSAPRCAARRSSGTACRRRISACGPRSCSAERALQRSEERQEAILRSLPVCFHSRSAEPPYGALYVSEAVERITGFPPRRFTEGPDFKLHHIHPDDFVKVVGGCRKRAHPRFTYPRVPLALRRRELPRFPRSGCARPADGGPAGGHSSGTLLDVTDQRTLEQQLVQAQQGDRRQLTGGIAHDFNNLLTVILGNLDLVERHIGSNERLKRQFASIGHAPSAATC